MNLRPRILGLDLGDSRTGVALSDPLGTAQPLLTMGLSTDKVRVKNIARLVRRYDVVAVVAGNPLHMSGDISSQAAKVQAFAATLQDALQIPVYLQDERLSSTAAHELMDRLGFPRGPDRKVKLDQYAAVVILQDWLDDQDRVATASRLEKTEPRSL
ncbi:MAG: Holliday junction resolvase RuvX [Janthinobacterium lividum]